MKQYEQVSDPSIEIHNLTVSYNRRPVLWDIDCELPKGKTIGIVGPNGAGKSTLLKALMQLIPTDSGYVRMFGKSLNEVRSKISYVPQRESVDWDFPASVMDVVLMGRYKKGKLLSRITKNDKEIAKSSLDKVGMLPFSHRQISQLSGGQQQRVFIARSLAQQADLYLMDEPFAGVDAASEHSILSLLTEMRDSGKTVLIVHHDLNTARQFFDWVILLNTHLVAVGPSQSVFTEQNLKETYGGQLTILSQVAHLAEQEQYPIRERKMKDRKKI